MVLLPPLGSRDLIVGDVVDASLGQVGLEWQLGGLAAAQPAGAMGGAGSTSQLVQAMAGFDGAAAGISGAVPPGDDPSQQPLLTTPQHA
jgi:hypothetical protein